MTSATSKDTPIDTQQLPAAPALASTASSKPTAKPKQRRNKPVKRRGAKVEEDEEQSEEVALKQKQAADASDSDESDFSVGGGAPEDEDEDEDDEESDAEGAADPKTPGTSSVEQLAPSADAKTSAKPLLDGGNAVHPSWSDMPEAGQNGSEDLPTLDFASLTPGTLAAVPAVASPSSKSAAGGRKPSATTSVDATGLSKKAQAQARRDAKSAELKAKDPVAWEAQEKERLEREVLKKKEKAQRLKEKRREKKLAEQQQQGDSTAPPAPSTETPTCIAPPTSTAPTGPRNAQSRPARPPVPSRPSRTAVQLGLVNDPEASTSSSTPRQPRNDTRGPPTGPASARPPHFHNNQGPSPDYIQAREAYSTRLANDPSYTPRVGKFWSHDDRLASPEVRPLVWRGRGGRGGPGGERGGFVGRGRGRGRGGLPVSTEGWTVSGGWTKEDSERLKEEEDKKEGEQSSEEKKSEVEKSEEDAEDDGWGRGEAKKLRNASSTPSAFASAPAWRHDGFEELQEDEARPASTNGRGRGGHRGRGGRGGLNSHDGNGRPIPGAVNPRYANLPFHPQHRFPAAASAPAPVETTSVSENQTTSRPNAGEASLFEESTGEEQKPPVGVRLPGSAAPVELAIKGAASAEQAEKPEEQTPVTVQVLEARAEEQQRRPSPSTVLYSAHPGRLPSDDQPLPPRQPPSHIAYPQHPPLQAFHQLPPHLQPQGPPLPYPSQQQVPRHASPAFYPHHPHQQRGYYSPDAFPSMPTPGATPPPPPLYPLGAGAPPQSFFAPPRTSKIEIKAPGSNTVLSASGDAFSPRGQPAFVPHQPQYSPISSRDGMGTPGSPQQMHRQQQQQQQPHQMHMQQQQQMAQQYGYAPSPYEYEQQGRGGQGSDGSYMPVENGGIVYFVKSPNAPQQQYAPQNPYYDPYAQQQQQGYGQHQDPAIMMSSGGGYGGQGGQGQMYQHWG